MKHLYFFLLLLVLSSCIKKEKNGIKSKIITQNDTTYKYYKDGTLKSKGILQNNLKKGWWCYYDSFGKLNMREEYVVIDSLSITNQIIKYDTAGSIIEDLSSYFEIELADTLRKGKNIGKVLKYSSDTKGSLQLLSVVKENRFSENEVKIDTFSDGTMNPMFGVYAYKVGKQKVKLVLIEETYNEVKRTKDSSVLEKIREAKIFEKDVYVKDTIDSH